jgi:DNA-binding protein HU-beta
LNRKELVTAIAEELEADKKSTDEFLSVFIDVVTTTVASGEPITITGFAKFARVERAARMGRNPQTGEAIKIAASRKVRITPLKAFKDAVLASKRGGVAKALRRK